ncbi:MAG TPA: aminopeptidase [Candidatus Binatia bacterium]|nr:aminopeptidase [Candidatus Binatia bacterium]
MLDPRDAALARIAIGHSIRLQPGETVLIESYDLADGLVDALVDAAFDAGGRPIVSLRRNALVRRFVSRADDETIAQQAELEMVPLRKAQAYVGLRAWDNVSELSDVPAERMASYGRLLTKPVHTEYRVHQTRWLVLRYPNAAMAQLARMSTERFADFYYDVCSLDYARMAEAVAPLAERMRRTDEVRLRGPGTDLRFRIRDIGVVPCEGRRNLPDGECFTAPIRDSVNGTIAYNTTSHYLGTTFTNVRLTFEGGRIVAAQGDPQDRLDHVLASDEGARHVGEFSLAFNPRILAPIQDTLFDEKIAGSLHFTPGQAYAQADNGNRSQIHWDLVLIQRPEYGGGEVWFDGELVRKDGRFVAPELEGLNPERLGAG